MATNIDVVKLDEKMLWIIKEKLDKGTLTTDTLNSKKQTRSLKSRKPKFEVYRPGVSRLSSRLTPARNNPDETEEYSRKHLQDEANEKSENTKSFNETLNERDQQVFNNTAPPTIKNKSSSKRNNGKKNSNKGRGRSKDYTRDKTNEEVEFIHDEMEWDNYGESDLIHCKSWSATISGGTGDSENGSHSQISTNAEECISCSSPLYRTPEHRSNSRCKTPIDMERYATPSSEKSLDFMAGKPRSGSIVSSDNSWNEKPKAHSTGYGNNDWWSGDSDNLKVLEAKSKKYRKRKKNSYRKQPRNKDATDESVEELEYDGGEDRRELFDPANPSQPIVIRSQDKRNLGDYYVPQEDENVYSSAAARERLLGHTKIQTKREGSKTSPYYKQDRKDKRFSHDNLSNEDHLIQSHNRNTHRKSYVGMQREAETLEASLSNILSCPSFDSQEFNDNLSRLRNKLKTLYENMILTDIDTATQNQVEQLLWKNVYYQIIEILREHIRNCSEDSIELKDYLLLQLDQATAFYESLLENLQRNYRFDLKEVLHDPAVRKHFHFKGGKRLKLAILSCQRTFISLGDIARYREQVVGSSNYGRSRHSYLQAQLLAPKNGRPYNQLAILAVKTRHKLDAVYYYVRSLAASNPILTARESLMALFDEIRRKLEYMEKKKMAKNVSNKLKSLSVNEAQSNSPKPNETGVAQYRPQEIWILPGQTNSQYTDLKKEEVIMQNPKAGIPELKLPINDQMKHFVLMFLNVHGKQFSRVGLENYSPLLCKTLKLFDSCLEHFSLHKLLPLFTINMFSVSNASTSSIHSSAQETKYNIHRALQVLFSMLALVVNHANKLLQGVQTSSSMLQFPKGAKENETLTTLISVIKIVFDWMYCNKELWYITVTKEPISSLTEKSIGLDFWVVLAELADYVCDSQRVFPVLTYTESGDGLEEVFLPEDIQMSGFSSILQTFSDSKYIDMESEMEKLKSKLSVYNSVRLEILRDFLDYLCGMDDPLLEFKQGKYVPVRYSYHSSMSDREGFEESFLSDLDSGDEINDLKNSINERNSNVFSHAEDELKDLKLYRDSLKEANDLKEQRKNRIEKSLNEEEDSSQIIEIRPRTLVPDTNCFIDHLEEIKNILNTKKFSIAVPLVVIRELEGLSKDSKNTSEHAQNVCANAKIAVSFIQKMVSQNSLLCPLTNEGTELHTLQFRSEEINAIGTNDDFILKSAQCLAKRIENAKSKKHDNKEIISKTVVLITGDRNLRLKSVMLDMPSKSIHDFCKWAGL